MNQPAPQKDQPRESVGAWNCACGYNNIPGAMDFCSACWADRQTGGRQWAKLAVMDFRGGGEAGSDQE